MGAHVDQPGQERLPPAVEHARARRGLEVAADDLLDPPRVDDDRSLPDRPVGDAVEDAGVPDDEAAHRGFWMRAQTSGFTTRLGHSPRRTAAACWLATTAESAPDRVDSPAA